MKSFKSHYNRSKFLPTLRNLSFESPTQINESFWSWLKLLKYAKEFVIRIGDSKDKFCNVGKNLLLL